MAVIYDVCAKAGVPCALSEVFAKGGEGGKALAETVLSILDDTAQVKYTYELDAPLTDKIRCCSEENLPRRQCQLQRRRQKNAGRADRPGLRQPAGLHRQDAVFLQRQCQADRPRRMASPSTSARCGSPRGAGFVVVVCGSIMTMPGLPKHPAAMDIDVDVNGKITGLF